MGKASRQRGKAKQSSTSSVLSRIVEAEASVNADIEKARIASRGEIVAAQESIPDIIAELEAKAREDARACERKIQEQSDSKKQDIQEQGRLAAEELRKKLNDNIDVAVDFIVGQVTHTSS